MCSGLGKGDGAQPQLGLHWLPSSAALSHPAASARRGKQGCSDTERGFVRSREPGLGRNPKMRLAIKRRSGKQGWWRIRRCHPPASAPGRGKRSVTRCHGGPVPGPRSLAGMDPEPGATGGKWGCWGQERRRDSGIAALCGGEADLEPEGTGKWGDWGGQQGRSWGDTAERRGFSDGVRCLFGQGDSDDRDSTSSPHYL